MAPNFSAFVAGKRVTGVYQVKRIAICSVRRCCQLHLSRAVSLSARRTRGEQSAQLFVSVMRIIHWSTVANEATTASSRMRAQNGLLIGDRARMSSAHTCARWALRARRESHTRAADRHDTTTRNRFLHYIHFFLFALLRLPLRSRTEPCLGAVSHAPNNSTIDKDRVEPRQTRKANARREEKRTAGRRKSNK